MIKLILHSAVLAILFFGLALWWAPTKVSSQAAGGNGTGAQAPAAGSGSQVAASANARRTAAGGDATVRAEVEFGAAAISRGRRTAVEGYMDRPGGYWR